MTGVGYAAGGDRPPPERLSLTARDIMLHLEVVIHYPMASALKQGPSGPQRLNTETSYNTTLEQKKLRVLTSFLL